MTRSIAYGLALTTACVATACVDVKADYNDWIIRTNYTRGNGVTETSDASSDAEGDGSVGGFTQTYFMACVSDLGDESVTEATEFTATATYSPPADEGGNGTFDFSDAALMVGATSLSQTVESPAVVNGSPVVGGFATVNFGAVTIPGAADPIGGADIVFSSLVLNFKVGPGDHICASLTGQLTSPDNEMLMPTTDRKSVV